MRLSYALGLVLLLVLGILPGKTGRGAAPSDAALVDFQEIFSPPRHEIQGSDAASRFDQQDFQSSSFRFAVIGDYGQAGTAEQEVAELIKSWNPDLIVTTGDNNYNDGAAETIDINIGQYFHDYIYPYQGGYGQGAQVNRFFPSLGNHDWNTVDSEDLPYPYLDYFTLPGNERYYDFTWGVVHFFVLDSDTREPDGYEWNSLQGDWLQTRLEASTAPWKVVVLHHAPYSSGSHGSLSRMQWPFAAWGADVVLAGHDHTYERISPPGDILYFVNGLGGRSIYSFSEPFVEGSQVRYNGDYGAMLVDVSIAYLRFQFINRQDEVVDDFWLRKPYLFTYLPILQITSP